MLLNEPTSAPIRKGPPRPLDAIAPFLATAGSYEMESEDDIGDALTLLAETGDAISMYAPGSREPILGRILSVDPEQPHFVMELNEGSALPPGKITFVSWLRSAKLQFRLASQDWKSVSGQAHLIPMVFPETCTVLNRRAFERVETPLASSFMASYVLNGVPHEVTIYDFSLGGIGLHCKKLEAKGLLKGRKLRDVELDLGTETVLIAELEIRYTRAFRSFLLGEQLHLGCKFSEIAPEEESKIKRVLEEIIHSPGHR